VSSQRPGMRLLPLGTVRACLQVHVSVNHTIKGSRTDINADLHTVSSDADEKRGAFAHVHSRWPMHACISDDSIVWLKISVQQLYMSSNALSAAL
jgi:hypothetical protein